MSGQLSERAQTMLDERVEHAREVVMHGPRWAEVELPAWVRERWPIIDLAEPMTLPEPDRCAEGRPWGADAYGSVWGTVDEQWRAYVEGRGARPCRNRWRDRATLLCGTHLNAWHATLADAAKRVARAEWQTEATELCRALARHEVEAEHTGAGLLLRPDAARQLAELLDHAAAHGLIQFARGTATPCDTPAPPTPEQGA